MSTIAIIGIVAGAIILALIVAALATRGRRHEKRRGQARELRDRASVREARAKKEEATAAEKRARAQREHAEAEERGRLAEREMATAGKEHQRAGRLDPDR
jgi:FtsZ-interacting cell division protein ZipA